MTRQPTRGNGDPRGWPFDESWPPPRGCAEFAGEALDALIDYSLRQRAADAQAAEDRRGGKR